jgi:glycosyltransferase involved in cell wall biosynthesis
LTAGHLGRSNRMNLNFFCQFNHTGVGRHCENVYLGIERQRPPGMYLSYVNFTRDASVRRLVASARPQTDCTVFFWRVPAELMARIQGRKIGWLFFESDRLPESWLRQMDDFDQLWMPTEWGRDVLLAHGRPAETIRVVEAGVDSRVYFPQPVAHEGFVFLTVGKYEERKSIDETVRAFSDEFPAAQWPKVELWIKADHPVFPDRVERLRARCAGDSRIRIISGLADDATMARLYNCADAFVFPTKAEGFGLPTIEALACGLPTVTTDYSGQRAFLTHVPGLYYPVQYEIADIVDPDFDYFYGRDYNGGGYGRWAVPLQDSIRAGLREVHDHIATWRERGRQASAIIHDAFSWDRIAGRAIETVLQQ